MRETVPHHLVDTIPLSRDFDVGQYLLAARNAIADVAGRGKLPIVAGGTGLYIRALTHGLDDLPKADPALRAALEQMEPDALRRRLGRLDPVCAERIDLKNKRRLIRAVEVCILTGKPFSEARRRWESAGAARGVFLTRDRDDLYKRIGDRVEEMFRNGVVREVAELPEPGGTARQAIGFAEIKSYLNGEITLAACMEEIKKATRRYAKRQLTWFRRQSSFEEISLSSCHPDFESALIARISDV